ncbi:hypothetical protein BGZ54_004737 [Gamsiella multidivaricata]|nr:hypothetical protein BGZ54_004737 [Gamsiella multidivaricata]
MDVDEGFVIPPRLPSFKKRTPTDTASSDVSVPPLRLNDDLTDDEDELENAKAALESAKLNLKQLDKHILRLQTRVVKLYGVKNDMLDEELAAAKAQRRIQFDNLQDLAEAHRNMSSSMAPLEPAPSVFDDHSSDSSNDTSVVPTQTANVFRRGLPMKVQSHWPRYKGKGNKSAYAFFDQFMRQVRPEIGEDIFKTYGPTYLTLLVTDDHFQDQLQSAFRKLEGQEISRDLMEQTFLDVCLTKEEREKSVAEVTKLGRHRGESYRVFAARIVRVSKQYRIQENNGVILTLLRQCIPPKDMDMVNLRYLYANPGTVHETPTTISLLCESLSKLTGPEDARDDFELPLDPPAGTHNSRSKNSNGRNGNSESRPYCSICKAYRHHTTEQHVVCKHCGRPGHQEDACYQLKNGDRGSSNNGTRRLNDGPRQENNRFQPYNRDSNRYNKSSNARDERGSPRNHDNNH